MIPSDSREPTYLIKRRLFGPCDAACMNSIPTTAPLVTTSDEAAAEAMISEGGAVNHPHKAPQHQVAHAWDALHQQAEVQFYTHPLRTILVMFGVGVLLGAAARRIN